MPSKPRKAHPAKKKIAKNVPKKEPKNVFIRLWIVSRAFLKLQNRLLDLTPFSRILLVYFLAVISANSNADCAEPNPGTLHRTTHTADEQKSVIASELISVVNEYILAGQMPDPHGRSKYLAAKVFYYGHALTNQQAEKQIISLYRRWPNRKYGQLEEPEIFAIPKKRNIYKVTGSYQYDLASQGEHLIGKSRITCVLEHAPSGNRIIGFDEKLITETTSYSRN